MKLERAIGIVIGIVTFGLAHALITSEWLRATLTPDPLIRPWFTNSTGAVLVTAALVAAGAIAWALGAADRRGAIARGLYVAFGAIVAMAAVLWRMGPGNLGPIVMLMGGGVLIAAGLAGGALVGTMKKM